MSSLSGKQKRHLRALGHHLKPVVQMGQKGATEALIGKVRSELTAHELIKVKVSPDAPVNAKEAAEDLHEHTGAAVAQVIGRIVVLYKARKKKPSIKLPAE